VEHCALVVTSRRERVNHVVLVIDGLEANEFLADSAGFVYQDATGDRDTRPLKTVPMSSQCLSAPFSPSRARLCRRTIFY
jgi:hypothetical protein